MNRLLLLCCCLLSAGSALAQQCTVIERRPNGDYKIAINSVEYRAIDQEAQRDFLRLQADLDAARKKAEAAERLLATYQSSQDRYAQMVEIQRQYIQELESVMAGYKELAAGYRKAATSQPAWVSLDVGLGATGSGNDPAILVGPSIGKLHLWGFLQKDNGGVLVGTRWPLF